MDARIGARPTSLGCACQLLELAQSAYWTGQDLSLSFVSSASWDQGKRVALVASLRNATVGFVSAIACGLDFWSQSWWLRLMSNTTYKVRICENCSNPQAVDSGSKLPAFQRTTIIAAVIAALTVAATILAMTNDRAVLLSFFFPRFVPSGLNPTCRQGRGLCRSHEHHPDVEPRRRPDRLVNIK